MICLIHPIGWSPGRRVRLLGLIWLIFVIGLIHVIRVLRTYCSKPCPAPDVSV